MAEEKDKKTTDEDKKAAPTLDEVDAAAHADLEEEDNDDEKDDDDKDESNVDKDKTDKKDDDSRDDAGGKGDSDDEDSDLGENDGDVVSDKSTKQPTRGSKANKVAVKGFDGKTHYFDSLDDVPDEFEPASYKEWGQAVRNFSKKEASDEQAAKDAEQEANDKEAKKSADALQKAWDSDIKNLKLDEDGAQEVYDYMDTQLKKGNIITNFETAYKAMNYDKTTTEDAKKLEEEKKKRGGRVSPGGSKSGTNSTVKKGVPFGVSIDDVHNKVLNDLG